MTHYLAVWSGASTLSNRDAAKIYADLREGRASEVFDAAIYTFSCALTPHFPDLEMTDDEDIEDSPWASALDLSGSHLIMAVRSERFASVFPVVLRLAEEHGLVCYDPQNTKVHLPSRLPN